MFRFKECREAAGISQKSAAITVGVKPPSMSDWENGRTSPTCDKLVKLSALYGVTVDELLGLEKPHTFTAADRRLLRLFHQLNDSGRAIVIATAEATLQQAGMRQETALESAM